MQCEKEALEKTLVELNEQNMSEHSLNYQLNHKFKYLSQRNAKQEKRIQMLQDKLKFLND